MARLNVNERAELRLLRDNQRRLIAFDGGAELMPWVAAHRLHKTEPYIGCPFCHDRFVLREQPDALADAVERLDLGGAWEEVTEPGEGVRCTRPVEEWSALKQALDSYREATAGEGGDG